MTPPAPRDGPSETIPGRRENRGPSRRLLAVAFGVSLVLHVLAILLYPVWMAPSDRPALRPTEAEEERSPEGTEIVRIVVLPQEEVEAPEEPDEERPATPVTPRAPTPTPPADLPGPLGEDGDRPPGLNAAERIRATAPDLRLIAPLPEDVVALSPEQIAQLELVWALAVANDSAALAAARARSLTDWTYTDSEGKRWGFSPAGLHLGDVVIPLPNLGAPYDPDAWKGSLDADLERGAASAEARDSGEDRARAIRERRDRERREPPDTVGGGGRGD